MRRACGVLALLLLFAALLAGGVARIALGLLLGLDRGGAGDFLFLVLGDPRRFGRGSFRFTPLLFGLLGFARLLCLGAVGGSCGTLGLPRLYRRIVRSRTRAKFVQYPLPCLRCGFLTVGEIGFFESAHWDPVVVMSGSVGSGLPIFAVSLSEPAAKCQRSRRRAEQGRL